MEFFGAKLIQFDAPKFNVRPKELEEMDDAVLGSDGLVGQINKGAKIPGKLEAKKR